MSVIENFILRFKTEGAGAIKAASDDLKGITGSSVGAGNALGNLSGRFTGVAGAALGAAGAIVAMGLKAVALADELQDLSDATGVSASKILNLKQSMADAGGSSDSYQKALSKLSVGIGEAMSGNEKYQKTFKELGVFVTDASGKLRSSNDILDDVIQSLANIEDPAIRAAKATEILGKEAAKIDWSKVRAGKDAVTDQQIAQLAKYQDAIDALKNKAQNELVRAFGNMAEAINKGGIVEGIAAITEEMGKLISKIPGLGSVSTIVDKARMERLGVRAGAGRGGQGGPSAQELSDYEKSQQAASGQGGFGQLGPAALASNKRIADAQIEMEKFAALAGQDARTAAALAGANERQAIDIKSANDIKNIEITLAADIKKAQADIRANDKIDAQRQEAEIAAKTKELQSKAALDVQKIREKAAKDATDFRIKQNAREFSEQEAEREANRAAIARQQDEYVKGAEIARLQIEEIKKGNNEFEARLELQQRISGLSAIDADRETKIFEAKLSAEQQLQALKNVANLENDKRLEREKDINDQLLRRIDLINQETETRKKNNEDFSKGVANVIKKYDEAYTPIQQGGQMAEIVFQNMERSLDNFVKTGKFNFRDFAASVISNIIAIQLKAEATSLLGGIFRSIFGLGGVQGGIPAGMSPETLALIGLANGGPVNANQPYLVGENGPEVFMPRTAGSILPNSQIAGQGLGGASVTYNIQAVDALSFKALVARDPSFLYAVTEKGRRNQPQRRLA